MTGLGGAFLAQVFLISAVSKVRALLLREDSLLLAKIPAENIVVARGLVSAIAAGELLLAVVVLLRPGMQVFGLIAMVLTAYTVWIAVRYKPTPEGCACFGGWFEFGGGLRVLMVRNLFLLTVALAIALRPPPQIGVTHSALAVASLSLLASLDSVARVSKRTHVGAFSPPQKVAKGN